MKRFLSRMFLFVSLPLALGIVWTAYVVAMDYSSYTRALVLPEGTVAAVCGDSQTKDALDPAEIPGFANFSTAATTCDQDLMRLYDLLVANRGHLHYVFLDVSPLKVGYMKETLEMPPKPPKPVSELNSGRVHALLHFYHLSANRRPLGSVGAIWRDVICVRKYNEFRKSILRGKKWRSSMAGAFDPDKAKGFLDPRYRAKALVDVEEKAARFNSRPAATVGLPLFAALTESVGLVRAAGAEPIVTTMPLSRCLREQLDAEKLDAFSEAARDVAVRLGVEYLDYLRNDLPDDCWHDGNHLNRGGAKEFAPRFARDFAELKRRRGASEKSFAQFRVERVGDVVRSKKPADLSGLSWAGGDAYWSVRDSGGELYELRIPLDRTTGKASACEVVRSFKVEGADDLEGTVYDPLRKSVWLSDENGPAIFEFLPERGMVGERVELPREFFGIRKNRGLEALEISPDGLDMWTCNENALLVDDAALPSGPSEFVRLTRFSRRDGMSRWQVSGQWAYRPESAGGMSIRNKARNGVASVLVVPDGTLLILEREVKDMEKSAFHLRLYQVDFVGATDVRGWTSLGDADFVPLRKKLLYEEATGRSMYEGASLGPMLADGSQTLVFVSDGDGMADERIMTLRLFRNGTLSRGVPQGDSK